MSRSGNSLKLKHKGQEAVLSLEPEDFDAIRKIATSCVAKLGSVEKEWYHDFAGDRGWIQVTSEDTGEVSLEIHRSVGREASVNFVVDDKGAAIAIVRSLIKI